MSGNSSWAGLRLRAAIGGTALWLLLQSPAASAFQLGALRVDSAPGMAYSAYVPVALAPGESLDYLIVDAHARTPGGNVPLAVQLTTSPEPRIELSAPMALPGGTTVDLDARLGSADVARVYAPAPPAAAPPPAYAAPAPAPYVAQTPAYAPPPPAYTPPPAYSAPVYPPVAAAPQPAYVPPPAYAPPPRDQGIFIRPTVETGYEFGGDRLLEVECIDTTDNSTSTPSLRSGSGLLIGGGAHIKPDRQSPYDLHVMFDYKYQSVCGSANLERFRLTVLPTYHFGDHLRWWAGAGLIYETGIKFNGDNLQIQGTDDTLGSTSLDNALGGTLRLGWWFLSLDYNFISYSKNGTHTNADDVGIVFTYDFDFF